MVKTLPVNAGDAGSISGSGIFLGKGNSNPLQYSCLGNAMDKGAWCAGVHGVTKSRTQLRDYNNCNIVLFPLFKWIVTLQSTSFGNQLWIHLSLYYNPKFSTWYWPWGYVWANLSQGSVRSQYTMSTMFLSPPYLGTWFSKKKRKENREAACNCQENMKLGARHSWIHIPALAPTSYGTLGKSLNLCLTSLNFSFLPCEMSIIIYSVLGW